MKFTPIYLDTNESMKLLTTGNGEAALLYLFLRNGNSLQEVKSQLRFTDRQISEALTILRGLELYQHTPIPYSPTKPSYSEVDILHAMKERNDFQSLTTEVQYRLGKTLNTEELKILLNMTNYLGLPYEVICLLVNHCVTKAKQKGNLKLPSLYQIEKEAYRWSDAGIESLNDAIAHIQKIDERTTKIERLQQLLQIRGRRLTPPEEKLANEWLRMGFSDEMLQLAYEKTCINTGGMNWTYMNKILTSWKAEGYRYPAEIKNRNKSNGRSHVSIGATGQLDSDELEAIQRMLALSPEEFLGSNDNFPDK